MLTKKPNMAPATTSTSECPTDSLKCACMNESLSELISWPGRELFSGAILSFLLPDLSENEVFVGLSLVGFKFSKKKGLTDLEFDDSTEKESVKSSVSVIEDLCSNLNFEKALFNTLAWLPTSLLTPCKEKWFYIIKPH